MNNSAEPDPWSYAAAQVARSARTLLPFAYGLCIAIAAFVMWEEIAEPLVSAAGSSGYYTFEEARGHVAANLLAALPVFPLIWGLCEVSLFLRGLARGGLWNRHATRAIARLGAAIILAGLVSAIIQPWLLGADGPVARARSLDLAVIALGIGLILLERLLNSLVRAANELRAENQSFI